MARVRKTPGVDNRSLTRAGWPAARSDRAKPSDQKEEPAASESFETAYEAGVEALLEQDLGMALDAFTRASAIRPSDTRVMANLSRLHKIVRKKKKDG